MIDVRRKVVEFFSRSLWETDTGSEGRLGSFLIKTVRLLNVAIREFTEGQLTLRAMSLVYTTLLSIVPGLAISFSVLKAFGVHNEVVEPFLLKFLAPMGERGQEITTRIISFVENMKVGVLGSLGLAMLIYTVTSMIQKIENAFNHIWRIRKPRSMARRFSDYVSVILIGPVLIFAAMGLTASVRSNAIVQKIISIEPFGSLFYFGVQLTPYIIVCATFTFLYVFLPNTRVRLSSAFAGGIFAGVLWEVAGWGFASFVVTSTKYAAIYSGFAILLMFMIWLYLSWLIMLVGAQVSFYHQYPHFLSMKQETISASNRLRERLSLLVMYLIGRSHYRNETPWTLEALVNYLALPIDPVLDTIELLLKKGLITETGDDQPAYLPRKDIGTITLFEIIDAVRGSNHETEFIEHRMPQIPAVANVMDGLDSAFDKQLSVRYLRDLIVED
jgi:membrane protein